MVIGNPTRTEESAIHGNRTERGALGTLAASQGSGDAQCSEFLSQTCHWAQKVG